MERVRKPIVFLSHSKLDLPFINQIETDLRHCQIYPWKDDVELRHGKPWLETIFQHGVAACDAELVYFTENSLASKVVAKEVDAGLLRTLSDSGVAFLPYVASEGLRASLRLDIQALYCPVWNEDNYSELLPKVVAGIWSSYTERTVRVATAEEKNRRLEAELALRNLIQQQGIFTAGEESDFEFVRSQLDQTLSVSFGFVDPKTKKERYAIFVELSPLSLLLALFDSGQFLLDALDLAERVRRRVREETSHRVDDEKLHLYQEEGYVTALWSLYCRFGLLRPVQVPKRQDPGFTMGSTVEVKFEFGDRMQRFRYWLTYRQISPAKPEVVVLSVQERPAE